MSLEERCKLAIRAALPTGAAWTPKPGGNYDNYLEALGEIIALICENLNTVRDVRDPHKTDLLDDLERDFGIIKNDVDTEEQRRVVLAERMFNSVISGNPEGLERILQSVDPGFRVYQNSPAVDPQKFIDQGFVIISRGRGDTFSGPIPEESWPLVWFVGGEATFGVSGEIESMAELVLPIEKESQAVVPILSYKGLFTWAAATFVLGTKGYLEDAVGNFICDANDNNIYVLFEWQEQGNLNDQAGDFLVNDSGDKLRVYY